MDTRAVKLQQIVGRLAVSEGTRVEELLRQTPIWIPIISHILVPFASTTHTNEAIRHTGRHAMCEYF